jgi:hypothetical protein
VPYVLRLADPGMTRPVHAGSDHAAIYADLEV